MNYCECNFISVWRRIDVRLDAIYQHAIADASTDLFLFFSIQLFIHLFIHYKNVTVKIYNMKEIYKIQQQLHYNADNTKIRQWVIVIGKFSVTF